MATNSGKGKGRKTGKGSKRSGKQVRRGMAGRIFWGAVGLLARIWVWLLFSAVIVLVLGAAVVIGIISTYSNELPDIENIKLFTPSETTQILDSSGRRIGELFIENREIVSLSKIPKNLQHAIIAIEDKNFYTHHGVNPKSVIRVFLENVSQARVVGGASTITMQLAKLMFLTSEQSMHRKILQALLAMELERKYTKEQLLETYLNLIYFGHGAHGVATAAHVYFNKSLKDLTLAECAFIAGLGQRPSYYGDNPEAARTRRDTVLKEMLSMNFVTQKEFDAAVQKPVPKLDNITTNIESSDFKSFEAPYFTTYVVDHIMKDYGANIVYREGLRVTTTLNFDLQLHAEEAVAWGITRAIIGNKDASQAALVAVDPNNGHIKAMVGGVDFYEAEFNRAWQSMRQPGSSFKPFVYLTAIEQGISMSSVRKDSRIEYSQGRSRPYVPHNYGMTFSNAYLALRDALRKSVNTIAVAIINEVGPAKVMETAAKAGIKSNLDPLKLGDGYLAMALGSSEVTPLEMASAYATFAAGGIYREPTAVLKIDRRDGSPIYRNQARERRVFPARNIYILTSCLQAVIKAGTGISADDGIEKYSIAGKTGTTDDHGDAWFVGFTPTLSVVVWIGNDNKQIEMKPVRNLFFQRADWLSAFLNRFVRGSAGVEPISDLVSRIESLVEPFKKESWARDALKSIETWRSRIASTDNQGFNRASLMMLFKLQGLVDSEKKNQHLKSAQRTQLTYLVSELNERMWAHKMVYTLRKMKEASVTTQEQLRTWRGQVQQSQRKESDPDTRKFYKTIDDCIGIIYSEMGNMRPITGGSYPARTWNYFMRQALKGTQPVEFLKPKDAEITQRDLGLAPAYPKPKPEETTPPEGTHPTETIPGLGATGPGAAPITSPPATDFREQGSIPLPPERLHPLERDPQAIEFGEE